ncbi:MAG TPA: hypothetical protein VFQ35_23005 [Polyangiaceae bacterium]|nr:hypothetical protein [Polyangiaceae bacterium]
MTLCGGFPGLALVVLGANAAAPVPAPMPTPVEVELEAPSGCADSRSFFERLRARTDRVRLAQPGERALIIDVRVSRVGAKVHGELRFRQDATESATRQVDGATCEEVVGVFTLTAALALERLNAESESGNAALAIDGVDGQGGASSAGSAKAQAGAPSAGSGGAAAGAGNGNGKTVSEGSGSDDEPPAETWETDPMGGLLRRTIHVELGAGVGLTQVLSPLLATGVGPLVRVRHRRMAVGLSSLYWSSRLTNADTSTSLRSLGFSLSACPWSWQAERVFFEPCVLGNVGFLHVSNSSVVNSRAADRTLWGIGVLGRVRAAISPVLALELEGGFHVPLVERRFITERPERIVAETPWISPFVGLAAVVSP